MHQHFEQFKQFLNQQESEYNRLLTRLRDEGLPASGQSSTAQPNSSGSVTQTRTKPNSVYLC